MKYGPRRIASNKRNKRPRKRLADKKQGTLCKGNTDPGKYFKKSVDKNKTIEYNNDCSVMTP